MSARQLGMHDGSDGGAQRDGMDARPKLEALCVAISLQLRSAKKTEVINATKSDQL